MKIKLFFLLTAFAGFTLMSCDKDLTEVGFEIGQSFELAHNQTANASDGQITVHFTNVASDSRCPADAVCVWEGESSIELSVKVNTVEEQITLSTHVDFGKRDTVSQFVFTLLDVQPYPCCHAQQIDQEDYVIELLVEAL